MIMNDAINASTSRIDKLRSFKAAIVNKFERETFEEFVQALRDGVNYFYKLDGHLSITGQDTYNHKFEILILFGQRKQDAQTRTRHVFELRGINCNTKDGALG